MSTLLVQGQFPSIHKLEDRFQKLGDRFQVVLNPMLEDSIGNIWIGSKNGLCRYSGSSIHCFSHSPNDSTTIPSNDIENIIIDSKNRIWVAMKNHGIQVVNLQGKNLFRFQYKSGNMNSLRNNRVWGMWEDHTGKIWISYFTGDLSSYNPKTKTFEHFNLNKLSPEDPRPKTVTYAVNDNTNQNIFWLFTTNGIVKWDIQNNEGKSFLFKHSDEIQKLDPIVKEKSSNWIRSVYQDDEGHFWLGTFGHFLKFDPVLETFKIITNSDIPLKHIIGIAPYQEDKLLISLREGLALIDKKEPNEIHLLSSIDPHQKNTNIMGRFYQSSNGCFYILNTAHNRPPGIYSICNQTKLIQNKEQKRSNYKIAVTKNFIHTYNHETKSISSESLLSDNVQEYNFGAENNSLIRSYFSIGNDSLLIATYSTVYHYHPNVGLIKIPDLSNLNLDRNESIFKDSKETIWIGKLRSGIFKYESNKDLLQYTPKSDPAIVYSDYLEDIYEDRDGDIWISTEQGWSMYNYRDNTFLNHHNDNIQDKFKISQSSKVAIRQTKHGNIWIADRSFGILIWDKVNDTLIQVLELRKDIKLTSIDDMEMDQSGNFWLLSRETGLACVDPLTMEVKTFGIGYGITQLIYDLELSDHGEIYVAHKTGYSKFDPNLLLQNEEVKTKPIISGFKIFDEDFSELLTSTGNIQLIHNQNYFSFDLSSINFQTAEEEIYEVKLHPFDNDWVPLGDKRFKGYTNVPAGDYEFKIRVKTNNVEWSYSDSVSIQIKAVWFMTWWARILAILTSVLLIYVYLDWKKKRDVEKANFEKQLAMLETKALRTQMNPHFLFNSLNSIRYQIVSNETQTAADYLTKFSRLIRLILQNSQHETVSLSDELALLDLYVQMEKIRFKGSFDYMIEIENSLSKKEVLIPSMIIQPFVENAILHGINPLKEQGEIRLQISKVGKVLSIVLTDNGIGRTKAQKNTSGKLNKKSLGMKITKDRVYLLKKGNNINDIIIEDLYPERENTGTKVIIRLPYLSENSQAKPDTK